MRSGTRFVTRKSTGPRGLRPGDADLGASGMPHKSPMSCVDLGERVKDMLLRPGRAWRDVRSEPTTAKQLYTSYAAILAAVPAVAHVLGMTLVGVFFLGIRYRAPFTSALGYAACFYLLSLASLYGYACIVDALAPLFHSEKGFINALKLTVYSSTPAWVSGPLLLLPALVPFVLLLSLYGLYLLYLGLLPMKGTPERYRPFYFLVLVIIGLLISFVVGRLSSFVFPAGSMGVI